MQKKDVLFVIPHLNGGGAEKVLLDILNNFDYEKYNVDLLVFFQEGVYIKYIPKNVNTKYIIKQIKAINKIPGKVKNLFGIFIKNFGMKKLYKAYVKKEYDIEIAFLEGMATKFVAASNNKKSKKIAWVHIDLFSNHWTKKYFKSLKEEIDTYKIFEKIICVSKDTKRAFFEMFGEMNNVEVIYNPLDIDKIKKMGSEGINKKEDFIICTVGRLVPQKGFDRLITVTKRLIDEGYKYQLNIVGCGGEKKKLLELINSYNIQEYVRLVGFDENPYKYIKESDIFVCSSRNEGFSLVVAEALILNKPIISTRCAGPVEILNDGEYGIITENSEQGLYESIKLLYHDKNKRNYFIEKSNERLKFFSLKDKMEQINNLL